ncbi:hypothetical protein NC651_027095 [Populus alba x Populus x berolinensis]|nr:hypothetical protein NC651_027095 [Populus alba x Populus x berolinensis]
MELFHRASYEINRESLNLKAYLFVMGCVLSVYCLRGPTESNSVSCVRLEISFRILPVKLLAERSKRLSCLRSAYLTDPNTKEHCSNCMVEKSQFDRREKLSGSSPFNPHSRSWRDDKEEDKFIKELGTTKDMFTPPK